MLSTITFNSFAIFWC